MERRCWSFLAAHTNGFRWTSRAARCATSSGGHVSAGDAPHTSIDAALAAPLSTALVAEEAYQEPAPDRSSASASGDANHSIMANEHSEPAALSTLQAGTELAEQAMPQPAHVVAATGIAIPSAEQLAGAFGDHGSAIAPHGPEVSGLVAEVIDHGGQVQSIDALLSAALPQPTDAPHGLSDLAANFGHGGADAIGWAGGPDVAAAMHMTGLETMVMHQDAVIPT
jgi:hypothetical protein